MRYTVLSTVLNFRDAGKRILLLLENQFPVFMLR